MGACALVLGLCMYQVACSNNPRLAHSAVLDWSLLSRNSKGAAQPAGSVLLAMRTLMQVV